VGQFPSDNYGSWLRAQPVRSSFGVRLREEVSDGENSQGVSREATQHTEAPVQLVPVPITNQTEVHDDATSTTSLEHTLKRLSGITTENVVGANAKGVEV
jgi:hypothetical protein